MIKKLSIEGSEIFGALELNFGAGFCVFSGPSGSGKSVLMDSLLSCFGLREPNAAIIETDILLSPALVKVFEEELGIEGGLINIKIIKKDKIRYFVNFAPIAKKHLLDMLSTYIQHIHSRGGDELGSAALLALLDSSVDSSAHRENLATHAARFRELHCYKKELAELLQAEQNLASLREIAEFEVQKIDTIAPNPGEYEKLLDLKKSLSRKEKLLESIAKAKESFEQVDSILSALGQIECMEARNALEQALSDANALIQEEEQKLEALDEIEAQNLLDRISALSSLIHRYGSIEAALEHRETQAKKLQDFSDTSATKSKLESQITALESALESSAKSLNTARQKCLPTLQAALAQLCEKLKLPAPYARLDSAVMSESGSDVLHIRLHTSEIATLSAGEFNRLRLAVMCLSARTQKRQGVLILDEIDANLSGAESEGVAHVLKELSASYQIFAISHQPHMPSLADHHFLVQKSDGASSVTLLNKEGRIQELARMISGSHITQEALDFAKKRLEDNA